MRYIKKLPETDHRLSEKLQKDGWIKIKEPKNLLLSILISFPILIILTGVMVWIGYLLQPELFNLIESDSLSITINLNLDMLLFVITLLIYGFVHEMIHAVFIPNFIKSDKTFWGLNGVFGFVLSTEPIKKWRFLLISCMPFVFLSLFALFASYLCGFLNKFTFLLFLINAAGSCVDFLNIVLISFQVKRCRTIISNGFETFYSPT